MKKLLLAMVTTSLLVACGGGGDSASSGDSYIDEKNYFSPSCSISKKDKIIFVEGSPNCKVNVAEINNGRTFTASCENTYANQVYVEASTSGDLNNVVKSVETGKPYIFACGSSKSLLSREECLKDAKNRMEEMECVKLAVERRSKNL